MTEKPHEVLIRAADLLEEQAGKATPGPWRSHDTHLDIGGHTVAVLAGEGKDVRLIAWLPTLHHTPWNGERNVWNDSQWMAMMDPAVAAPLALWLRTAARQWKIAVDLLRPERAQWIERERYAGALGFARMVLGEAT